MSGKKDVLSGFTLLPAWFLEVLYFFQRLAWMLVRVGFWFEIHHRNGFRATASKTKDFVLVFVSVVRHVWSCAPVAAFVWQSFIGGLVARFVAFFLFEALHMEDSWRF